MKEIAHKPFWRAGRAACLGVSEFWGDGGWRPKGKHDEGGVLLLLWRFYGVGFYTRSGELASGTLRRHTLPTHAPSAISARFRIV